MSHCRTGGAVLVLASFLRVHSMVFVMGSTVVVSRFRRKATSTPSCEGRRSVVVIKSLENLVQAIGKDASLMQSTLRQ